MAAKKTNGKKKPKIQASEIEVGKRALEAVLADVAERSVLAEERSARAEEGARVALEAIAATNARIEVIEQDIRTMIGALSAMNRDHMALAESTGRRLDALEKAS